MASSLKLKNANGKTLAINNSDSNTEDIVINGGKITTYVDTVEDLASSGSEIGTVIVSDKDMGGIFNAITSELANNGTIFDGSGCSWERQSSGAINVKWFGAKGDGVDDTTAITAAWTYIQSISSDTEGDQYPDVTQKALYFPSGRYKANLNLDTTGTGFSIFGDGNTSVLEDIRIEVSGDHRGVLHNFMMVGSNNSVGLNFKDGASKLARQWLISDLYIRDKTTGIYLNGSTWNSFTNVFVEKCTTGLKVDNTSGDNFTSCEFNSCTLRGIDIRSGGELKFTNCRSIGAEGNNLFITGNDTTAVVEHYFDQCTFTGCLGTRDLSISSIVNDGNGKAQITANSHFLGIGVTVEVTGTTNYNGTHIITEIIDANTVVTDVAYVSDEATGTLAAPEWDVKIFGQGSVNRNVNDLFFVGGNINHLFIDNSYNINFNGTRLKNQIYLTPTCNRIMFVRNSRGRDANDVFKNIQVSGSTTGWADISVNDEDGTSSTNTQNTHIKLTAEGNTVEVGENGILASTLNTGKSTVIADGTGYSFTPTFERGFMIITNGNGQNARMAQVTFAVVSGDMRDAGFLGSVMNIVANTQLDGTNGTAGKINISAANDGKIYIGNQSGSSHTMYWTLFR